MKKAEPCGPAFDFVIGAIPDQQRIIHAAPRA
jgi:hypothetical protein